MKNSLTVPRHWDIVTLGIILVLAAGVFGLQGYGSILGNILGIATFGLIGALVAYMPLSAARYNMPHKDKAELSTRLFGVYAIISVVSYLAGTGLRFLFFV